MFVYLFIFLSVRFSCRWYEAYTIISYPFPPPLARNSCSCGRIGQVLTKKTIRFLQEMMRKEPEKFKLEFFKEFGSFLKEVEERDNFCCENFKKQEKNPAKSSSKCFPMHLSTIRCIFGFGVSRLIIICWGNL